MPNAARILTVALGAAAIAACHKAQPPVQDNQDMSPESNLAAGNLPQNVDIETLPADESSATSNGELAKGNDNPDVNDLGNSH
jgi:hypothetical protein